MTTLADQSLRAFVDALASAAPSPGAGAAAAVALALAAACAQKAIAITRRHGGVDADMEAVDRRLAAVASGALQGAVADAELFARLIHAISAARKTAAMPKDASAVQDRAADLADEGERLMALAGELRALLAELRGRIDPSVAGDVAAALSLADAFAAIQLGNLRENQHLAVGATRV